MFVATGMHKSKNYRRHMIILLVQYVIQYFTNSNRWKISIKIDENTSSVHHSNFMITCEW